MNKVKSYAIFLLSAIMLTSIVGCSKDAEGSKDAAGATATGSASGEKIKLTVTSTFNDETGMKGMKETIKVFNETHPNVEIEFSPSPWADYAQNLKLAFNSDSGQDIVYVDDTMQQMLQGNNYLMDLTAYVKSHGWTEKVVPGAIDFNNSRTPGKYYSVPFMAAPVVVYYNKDIFNKLQLTPPKTLDELNAVMDKAKAAGLVPMENGGMSNNPKMWTLFHMLYNQVSMDDVKQFYFQKGITPAFEKGFVDSLNKINDWVKKGYYRADDASITGDAVPTYYAKGQSAMVLGGNWDIPTYEGTKIPTGAFAFPKTNANSTTHTIINPSDGGWALNAKLSPAKKQAALDFIETFMNPKVVKVWYENGATPIVNADLTGANVSDLKKEVDKATEGTQMGYYLDNAVPGLGDIVIKQLQLMSLQKSTPDQAWTQIKSEYDKLVKAAQGK